MRVIIRGSWAPYVGTDYCDALGVYDSVEDAREDAETYASDQWQGEDEVDDDGEVVFEDEGPDYYIEEYDPEKHDQLRAGGGSFADDPAFQDHSTVGEDHLMYG